jgi:hypothetical protein
MKIVCSSRCGPRDIEHIGPGRDNAELELLKDARPGLRGFQ